MNESGKEKLRSVLFDGDGELRNVKFFPGTGRGLTSEKLAGAAADGLAAAHHAWAKGLPSRPPQTGMEKCPILG